MVSADIADESDRYCDIRTLSGLPVSHSQFGRTKVRLEIIGLLYPFGILLGLSMVDQYLEGEAATVPFRILRNRSVLSRCAYTLFCDSATMVVLYYMPTCYQSVRGPSASQSGYYQFPAMAGNVLGLLTQSVGVSSMETTPH